MQLSTRQTVISYEIQQVLQLQYKKLHISFRCNSTFKSCQRRRDGIFPLFHPLIHPWRVGLRHYTTEHSVGHSHADLWV